MVKESLIINIWRYISLLDQCDKLHSVTQRYLNQKLLLFSKDNGRSVKVTCIIGAETLNSVHKGVFLLFSHGLCGSSSLCLLS